MHFPGSSPVFRLPVLMSLPVYAAGPHADRWFFPGYGNGIGAMPKSRFRSTDTTIDRTTPIKILREYFIIFLSKTSHNSFHARTPGLFALAVLRGYAGDRSCAPRRDERHLHEDPVIRGKPGVTGQRTLNYYVRNEQGIMREGC